MGYLTYTNPKGMLPLLRDVFIETGTYLGHGVRSAIAAGFGRIISIEVGDFMYKRAKDIFSDCPQVTIMYGDSGVVLGPLLAGIDEQITFWLDGHFAGPLTGRGEKVNPLEEELVAIKAHKIRTHTIIIDDVKQIEEELGIDRERLRGMLLDINKDYEIVFTNEVSGDGGGVIACPRA